MATELLTNNFEPQNFYQAQLTADIGAGDLDIFLDTVPNFSEGTLVIDPESDTNREIIYYSSKTATKVTCPANGRAYDNTTATSHSTGTTVIMAPIADWFNSLRTLFTTTPTGYTSVGGNPSTVTYNGNRSYTMVFSGQNYTGTLSPGMRLKATRTVTAPIQCTDLESSSSQYYSKTTPAGMTFTDDFVVSAWVKLESYTGATQSIATRYNATSGWNFYINSSGQVELAGNNAGAANFSRVVSYQSIPVGKWVHIAAQLDMSAFTATTTTSYVMIDGVDVPSSVSRGGTNPTALIQAGNLEIGGTNGGANPFDGKLAQVAIYSAKVTQANVRATVSQGLVGTETNLISAYSFNNSINDLNTGNANNLTPNNSAAATATDSPFASRSDLASGITAGTTEYAIITSSSFSADTTLIVQVPEGGAIPTSGGVSAVSYSTQKVPYGFPAQRGKWIIKSIQRIQASQVAVSGTWYNLGSFQLNVPVGSWIYGYQADVQVNSSGSTVTYFVTLATSASSETDVEISIHGEAGLSASNINSFAGGGSTRFKETELSTATQHYLNVKTASAGGTLYLRGDNTTNLIFAECAYL
jgi:VCBS repeat-containing protein